MRKYTYNIQYVVYYFSMSSKYISDLNLILKNVDLFLAAEQTILLALHIFFTTEVPSGH